MFKNVGSKIKWLAIILCIIGITLSLLIGLARITIADRYMFITGAAIAIAGSVSSYVICLLIYGFGELIETNKKIAENTAPEKPKNYWIDDKKEQ